MAQLPPFNMGDMSNIPNMGGFPAQPQFQPGYGVDPSGPIAPPMDSQQLMQQPQYQQQYQQPGNGVDQLGYAPLPQGPAAQPQFQPMQPGQAPGFPPPQQFQTGVGMPQAPAAFPQSPMQLPPQQQFAGAPAPVQSSHPYPELHGRNAKDLVELFATNGDTNMLQAFVDDTRKTVAAAAKKRLNELLTGTTLTQHQTGGSQGHTTPTGIVVYVPVPVELLNQVLGIL